jgi:gliding motility-associated-like protein
VTASSSDKLLVPDANIILSGSGASRVVRITPATDQSGKTTTVTLTVTDGSATAQTTFVVTVTPVNDAPTITGQDPLTTPEDTPLTLDIKNFDISDPDNVATDYSLIIFNGTNYKFAGTTITPSLDFDGELFVPVKVSDGKLFSKEYVAKITVTDVNIAPVIVEQSPNPIKIQVNTSLALDPLSNIKVLDVDAKKGDVITLLISEGENYTVSGPNLNIISPFANYTGDLNVVIRASDGKSTSEPFTVHILVVLPSAVPLITGQDVLIIDEDHTLTLEYENLKVSDADDPYPLGFTMNIQPGKNYSVDDRVITPSLNFNDFLEVGVTVNDGEKTSDVFTLRIYVVPVNDAPEITILESDPISYEPGTGPISITEEFEAVDVDNDFLQLAQIALIDSNFSSRNDELIFENSDTSPIRGVYDASKGVLSLLGYATTADYIAAMRSIKYNYLLTLDNNGKQTPISTTPKRVSITLSDGQLASEKKERSIELKTSVELSIPNTFTPNGDSENNTWAVQPVTKSDQFDDTIVRVYNKRGLLVYEAVGLEKEWDGTFNGELLPVDTYYYTIDLRLSFTKKTYKGAVMILR